MAVTGLDVEQRAVVLGGQPFGSAGAYEKVVGSLRLAVDPALPMHRQITDIDRAPRGARGLVEFRADFHLLQPADPARGNRRLVLDLPNRGRTYTGWNLRHPDHRAPGDLMSMMGATLPFPLTRADRERTGDPHPAIEERYESRAAYLGDLRALAGAVAARHILAEDVDAILDRAGRLWDYVHGARGRARTVVS